MAAYPTLMQLRTTTIARDAGLQTTRATNGRLRVRGLFPADKADFDLVHWCTTAEKDALMTFYAANRLLDITYTDPADGASYTVRFAAAPLPVDMTPWWEVRVRLREV
jgi:hypothetical protein